MNAKEYSTKRYSELLFMLSENDIHIEDELAEMLEGFAKIKWDEACEAQKKICAAQETPRVVMGGIETWNIFTNEEKDLILDSPKAEYK